jgi:hypothetical protein
MRPQAPRAGIDHRQERSPTLHARCVIALLIACLGTGCDTAGNEAKREYLNALELTNTGRPLEEQVAHMDRAVRLAPPTATKPPPT